MKCPLDFEATDSATATLFGTCFPQVRQELNAHDDGVTAVAWARFLLASGDRTGRILVWNSMNFALLYSLDGHSVRRQCPNLLYCVLCMWLCILEYA